MTKMHENEFHIDEALVHKLIAHQFPQLSNALIALPYYKDTNPVLANNARHVIQEIIEEERKPSVFYTDS